MDAEHCPVRQYVMETAYEGVQEMVKRSDYMEQRRELARLRGELEEHRQVMCLDRDVDDGLVYVCVLKPGHAGMHERYYACQLVAARAPAEQESRFPSTWCSQCGREFGPGDSGFSHCDEHRAPAEPAKDDFGLPADEWDAPAKERDDREDAE